MRGARCPPFAPHSPPAPASSDTAGPARCRQKKHPKGGPAAEQVVNDFAAAHPGDKVALGWGPESAYVAALGEKGFYVHASDDSVPNFD